MRIEGERRSDNVEDRRAMGGGRSPSGRHRDAAPRRGLRVDGRRPLPDRHDARRGGRRGRLRERAATSRRPRRRSAPTSCGWSCAETEDVWDGAVPRRWAGRTSRPKLVLFRGQVQSACGIGERGDGAVLLPGRPEGLHRPRASTTSSSTRFDAPGDFAQAYVIAHEVGHHVQNLLGISDKVHASASAAARRRANALSVRLELQADFLRRRLGAPRRSSRKPSSRPATSRRRCSAATAIGDDRSSEQATGRVVPTRSRTAPSAQRVAWFKLGFQTGDVRQGNTFDDADLRPGRRRDPLTEGDPAALRSLPQR